MSTYAFADRVSPNLPAPAFDMVAKSFQVSFSPRFTLSRLKEEGYKGGDSLLVELVKPYC